MHVNTTNFLYVPVVLGLVSSVTGWKECLGNSLFLCAERDVQPQLKQSRNMEQRHSVCV